MILGLVLGPLDIVIAGGSHPPHERAELGDLPHDHLNALPKWPDNPQIIRHQFSHLPGQKPLDNLQLLGGLVPLVVTGHNANQPILDEYVPDPSIAGILVPDPYCLGAARGLARREMRQNQQLLLKRFHLVLVRLDGLLPPLDGLVGVRLGMGHLLS